MNAQPGDKIRIKIGTHAGVRGVVESVDKSKLFVQLSDSAKLLETVEAEVTNFSLSARKAWDRMPDRRVGRPKGTTRTDRVSVTLRIDREVWERFKRAEVEGVIKDRTATLNAWIASQLDGLLPKE